eukprot:3517842-Prorocentrum_lima.AAC.1
MVLIHPPVDFPSSFPASLPTSRSWAIHRVLPGRSGDPYGAGPSSPTGDHLLDVPGGCGAPQGPGQVHRW